MRAISTETGCVTAGEGRCVWIDFPGRDWHELVLPPGHERRLRVSDRIRAAFAPDGELVWWRRLPR